jgi:hypothetical protein
MDKLLAAVTKLPPMVMIPVLIVILLILILIKWDKIISFFKNINKGKKRTCSDCIKIMNGLNSKTNNKIRLLEDKLHRDRMNFVKHKTLNMQRLLYQEYYKLVRECNKDKEEFRELKECNLFNARLIIIMGIIEDEFERSFLENGFHDMNYAELNDYIQNQIETIIAMFDQYMVENYPRDMIVDHDKALPVFVNFYNNVKKDVEIIYNVSIEIKNSIEEKKKRVEKEFIDEINKLVEVQ